ncbi:hypothetical protein N7541_011405 [Penicillium brevicompactum]|uniref:Uncharacterized protein n=1 Tax=Penicillium brevicompactum TaxID=5074 RepID=A0A9W9QQF5_PENBR|nr:hypothetical protein N7541_011405 [Penicillium brevicompactum]
MTNRQETIPKLTGKVALVTGGGSGIGQATALCLASAGARVVIADIDTQAGQETAKDIQKQTGSRTIFVRTDVSQSHSIQSMVRATVEEFGRLDIAVNNAGVHPDSKLISSMDEQHWNRVISTHLTGVALCLKWELQQMIDQGEGGSIINMASATVFRAQPKMAAYVAAKHGILGLTQTAALENGKHRIRVNALAPGAVATNLTMATLDSLGLTESAEASRTSLFGRFAKPHEIAKAVLWLASDASAYMTGTTMPVDGGMSVL